MREEGSTIRLVFCLDRDEHPRLFDDLIRFRKGVRRVNRLRLLAHDGLLSQSVVDRTTAQLPKGTTASDRSDSAEITDRIFLPPLN